MQPVSEQFKNAISQLSRELKARITFPGLVLEDDNIQSIEWDSTLVGADDFEIGTAPMDMVRINLVSEVDSPMFYDFDDEECEIEIGVQLSHSVEYVSIGKFTVDNVEKKDNTIHINAVDRMYKFEKQYESDLDYPASLSEIALDICDVAGVELATTIFTNSDYTVNTKPELDEITCRTAIAQIAELAGGYARIDRSGKLEIFNIQTTAYNSEKYAGSHYILGDLFIADELIVSDIEITGENYIDFSNKRLPTAKIEKIIVKTGDEEASKGIGENTYYIVNNVFCQNPHAAVDTLYEVLSGLSYTPFNMKWQGNPAVDCGDMITVRSVHGGYYNTLITRRSLTYTGGLREDYEAVGKSNIEKESTPKGSLTIDTERGKLDIRRLTDELSVKVSKDSIISEINLSTEGIRIRSDLISLVGAVEVLSSITGNLGEITAGSITGVTITGGTIRTSAGNNRIELSSNLLRSYLNGIRRVQLDYDSLDFWTANNRAAGTITSVDMPDYGASVTDLVVRNNNGFVSLISGTGNDMASISVNKGLPDYGGNIFLETRYSNIYGFIDMMPGGVEIGTNGAHSLVVHSGGVDVYGSFAVSGSKSAVVETEDYGWRKLYALETPDNRFVTYIETELEVGEHYIEIEPMFRQTISDYFVVPHIQNMASVYIMKILKNGFKVLVENKPAEVVFEINGRRKGYEDVYMEEVNYEHQTE
jgi:hypothetical protein